jgi:hypothetical protein
MNWRRTTKPEPHVQLLMELENDNTPEKLAAAQREQEGDAAPWDKSSDWWKTQDD